MLPDGGRVGVVYGDIGTAAVHAARRSAAITAGLTPNVLGVLSVIFWSLVIVVTLKYVTLIMRADNNGEGGILALTALVSRGLQRGDNRRWWLVGFGIFGAAMFYGDGMITPAISCCRNRGLNRRRGVRLLVPPISLAILFGLFVIQATARRASRRGSGRSSSWSIALAAGGLLNILDWPMSCWRSIRITASFPSSRARRLDRARRRILAVTGAEALYADLGHFGAVLSAPPGCSTVSVLTINYLGQGALPLGQPEAGESVLQLYPAWALAPMIGPRRSPIIKGGHPCLLGAQQAIQLGLPRMNIRRTSATERGQIYPGRELNLLLAVLFLAAAFRARARWRPPMALPSPARWW
jgi:KUP system potassium uptake protein